MELPIILLPINIFISLVGILGIFLIWKNDKSSYELAIDKNKGKINFQEYYAFCKQIIKQRVLFIVLTILVPLKAIEVALIWFIFDFELNTNNQNLLFFYVSFVFFIIGLVASIIYLYFLYWKNKKNTKLINPFITESIIIEKKQIFFYDENIQKKFQRSVYWLNRSLTKQSKKKNLSIDKKRNLTLKYVYGMQFFAEQIIDFHKKNQIIKFKVNDTELNSDQIEDEITVVTLYEIQKVFGNLNQQ